MTSYFYFWFKTPPKDSKTYSYVRSGKIYSKGASDRLKRDDILDNFASSRNLEIFSSSIYHFCLASFRKIIKFSLNQGSVAASLIILL